MHRNSVKNDTLNILLNAGELRNAVADLALAHEVVCVGSSANVWLSGTKYRLEDVDPELRAILEHNGDEEKEHAAMALEWLRRHDPVLDRHLRKFLFREGSIVGREDRVSDASEIGEHE